MMAAELWLYVHLGLQLHRTHHVGRLSDVRPKIESTFEGSSANLIKNLLARLCKVGDFQFKASLRHANR